MRSSPLRTWLILSILALIALAACNSAPQADGDAGGWVGTTVQEGPTTTVRTTGGSVWSGDGRLIEEVAIGTETRGEYDLLGRVEGIAATADRIFICDSAYSTIRVFDLAGDHVRNIGRKGRGPGELSMPGGLGVDPDAGYLYVRESTRGSLHRFTLNGEYLRSLHPGLQGGVSGYPVMLRITRTGTPIVTQFSHRRAPETDLGYVGTAVFFSLDPSGAVADTLHLPVYDHEHYILTAPVNREAYRPEPVPFGPQEVWSISYDGAVVFGYAAEYRLELHYPDGRRTIIEREAEPVRVLPGEREWHSRKVYGIMRHFRPGWAWNGPEIPSSKPWFAAIYSDRSGRIWVLRQGEGRPVEGWTEPEDWRGWERSPGWTAESWFEVFEETTGHYLGRVPVPAGFSSWPEPFIEGDTFICLTGDEEGRPIVRRYRLEVPPAG